MKASGLGAFIGRLRYLAALQELDHLGDGQLLDLFVARQSQDAFTALVRRHGTSVWHVCSRLVRSEEDAEDAFQATFLALARRGRDIRRPEAIGPWLRKVALRAALEVRTKEAKRSKLERHHEDWNEIPDDCGSGEASDVRRMLMEEIGRLPERFRLAVILCYLEGKTVEEAAGLFDCPRGTVLSRLARARQKLHLRLSRRGVAVSDGALALVLARPGALAPLRSRLMEATVRTAFLSTLTTPVATGLAASNAAVLAEGVFQSMFLTKVKLVIVMVVAIGLLASGMALWHYQASAGENTMSVQTDTWPMDEDPLAQALGTSTTAPAPIPRQKKFDNAPGWRWFFAPCPPASRQIAEKGMVCLVNHDQDGAQLVYLAYSGNFDRSHPEYRPVMFDAAGKRHVAEPDQGGSSGKFGKQVSLIRFRLDPTRLRHENVTEIGVEQR